MSNNDPYTIPETPLRRWGFLFIPCALMLCLLWLPFGFSIHGILEEWDVLSLFTSHGPFVWVSPDGPLGPHRLRPLTVAPHAMGYLLDPNSFFYWNWLLVASLMVKGVGASLIGWWLTHSRRWAVVLGLLVVFYPADTMQLSFRSFHINWSIALSLLSVALCAAAYSAQKRWHAAVLMSVAAPCAVLATFLYEAALTFAVAPLLLLYARFGLRETWARISSHRVVTAAWIVGVLINVIYAAYAMRGGDSYQVSVISSPAPIDVLDRLRRVFLIGYGRALVGGWLDAVAVAWFEFRNYLYILLSSIFVGVVAWRCSRPPARENAIVETTAPSTSLVRVAVVGLILLGLGYLPFAASPAHMAISQRTFLGATAGAALVCIALLIAVSRRSRGMGIVLATGLLVVAFAAQMFQFDHYRRLSETQATILGDIVENAPPPRPNQTLVILDKRDQINDVWMVREGMVRALTYLYDRPIAQPVICSPTSGAWQLPNGEGRLGTCEETEAGWVLTLGPLANTPDKEQPPRMLARDDAVVVTLEADGTTTSSAPPAELAAYRRMLETGTAAVAERYRNILRQEAWPLAFEQFRHLRGGDRYRWDFGRWWSMEEQTRGAGWMVASWTITRDRPVWRSTAWKIIPEATLQFDLIPSERPYELVARIPMMVPPTTPDTIEVRVNDQPVAVEWRDAQTLTAAVPSNLLKNGVNVLTFVSPLNSDPTPLGFMMDWITLDPAPAASAK